MIDLGWCQQYLFIWLLKQGRQLVSRHAHNVEIGGSIPSPATLPLALTAHALPFLPTEIVGGVGIFSPIPFNGVRSGAVGICLLGAGSDTISSVFGLSCLSVLDSLGSSCGWVLDNFLESFFHIETNPIHLCVSVKEL